MFIDHHLNPLIDCLFLDESLIISFRSSETMFNVVRPQVTDCAGWSFAALPQLLLLLRQTLLTLYLLCKDLSVVSASHSGNTMTLSLFPI